MSFLLGEGEPDRAPVWGPSALVLDPRDEREEESAGAPDEALKLIGRDPMSELETRLASEAVGWCEVKKPAWSVVRRSVRANLVIAIINLGFSQVQYRDLKFTP